jgi:hypothetical protein
MGIRAQRSRENFVGQLFLSLESHLKYSKEKAEKARMLAGTVSWDITESLQYKITLDYPKKNSCNSQDWRYIPRASLVQGLRNMHWLRPA